MNKTDKIWLERKNLLDKLESDVRSLIMWRIAWHQKVGYWQAIYQRFLKEIIKQDQKLGLKP